jgi:hypothetical protein
MVPLTSLWLPILVSAVIVFFASSILHMVLPIHHKDFGKVPNEDGVMDAMRKFSIPPGDYLVPCGGGPSAMKDPAFIERMNRGPVMLLTVMPAGMPSMGVPLAQWFVCCIIVSVFAAYVAGRALGVDAPYLAVFRFSGTVAFVAYTIGQWQDSIWYKRSWWTTTKNTFDGLVYALLTAGVFGWLWPR